jgi:hypothetical protein
MADTDVVRALAAWALVHEMADEGWKAAVDRGTGASGDAEGPGEMVDGISALIYREKERLKGQLAGMTSVPEPGAGDADSPDAAELRFELSEMRGRLESIESALDALILRLDTADVAE